MARTLSFEHIEDGASPHATTAAAARPDSERSCCSVDVVLALDGTGRFVWASDTCEQVLGWPAADLVKQHARDVMHPDDAQLLLETECAAGGVGRTSITCRIRERNGTYRHLQGERHDVVDDPVGRQMTVLTLSADDSSAARLEDNQPALIDPQRLQRLVIENSRDAITVTGAGVVLWSSPSIVAVTGKSPRGLIGTQLLDLVHVDYRATLEAARRRLRHGDPGPISLRIKIWHAEGMWHWVDMRIAPFADDDGTVIGGITNWRLADDDVAALEALTKSEAENRALAAQLQQALDSRVVIEQAKGIIACERGISVDDAFKVLRTHARSHSARVEDVARSVVELGLRP